MICYTLMYLTTTLSNDATRLLSSSVTDAESRWTIYGSKKKDGETALMAKICVDYLTDLFTQSNFSLIYWPFRSPPFLTCADFSLCKYLKQEGFQTHCATMLEIKYWKSELPTVISLAIYCEE